MTQLVKIADKAFELPEGLSLKSFEEGGGHATYALVDKSKIGAENNKLGIVASLDRRAVRGHAAEAIGELLEKHGAKPASLIRVAGTEYILPANLSLREFHEEGSRGTFAIVSKDAVGADNALGVIASVDRRSVRGEEGPARIAKLLQDNGAKALAPL